MKNVLLHQLGEKVRSRQVFNCAEGGFKRGALCMLMIAMMCYFITANITKPDLSESPVIRMDGYVNLMVACDFVPGNYFGGLGWMACLSLYLWSVHSFYARAKLTAEEGMCSEALVQYVKYAGWVFVCTAPFGYLWFEVHPTFDDPNTLSAHLQGLVAMYFSLAQWILAQWVFAKAVLPARKHGFKAWTIAVWSHLILTVVVVANMEMGLMNFVSTREIPPLTVDVSAGFGLLNRVPKVMQIFDLLRWFTFFWASFFSVLDGWSPIAPWNESERGGMTCHGRLFAPYVKVDQAKSEEVAKKAALIAEAYEEHYDHSQSINEGCDEDWGATIANLNATFEIDERINFLHPDLRAGFLEKPAKYEAIARVSITTLAWARMAVRVTLPDSVNEKTDMLKPALQTLLSGNESAQRLVSGSDADKTKKVADFLFQEDLKEFTCMDEVHLHTVLQASHRPKGWGMLRWLWHRYWNSAMVDEAKANMDLQMIRTSPEGRLPDSGIFGKRYFGGLPFRLGPGACKWGLQARQKHLIGEGAAIHQLRCKGNSVGEFHAAKDLGADRYKTTAIEYLKEKGDAVFDFVVQVATDDHHDLYKGSAIWPEDTSPYITVGTLTIPGGQGIQNFEDGLAFSVFNNLEEHGPVGAMNMALGLSHAITSSLALGTRNKKTQTLKQ